MTTLLTQDDEYHLLKDVFDYEAPRHQIGKARLKSSIAELISQYYSHPDAIKCILSLDGDADDIAAVTALCDALYVATRSVRAAPAPHFTNELDEHLLHLLRVWLSKQRIIRIAKGKE
jgi:hypothetical protein